MVSSKSEVTTSVCRTHYCCIVAGIAWSPVQNIAEAPRSKVTKPKVLQTGLSVDSMAFCAKRGDRCRPADDRSSIVGMRKAASPS
eukprot:447408-Ditylum_brightwellii.AAC.1